MKNPKFEHFHIRIKTVTYSDTFVENIHSELLIDELSNIWSEFQFEGPEIFIINSEGEEKKVEIEVRTILKMDNNQGGFYEYNI